VPPVGARLDSVDALFALGGAKLAINAVEVAINGYRARTERLSLEIERAKVANDERNPPRPERDG
jgi:hypothetical protein